MSSKPRPQSETEPIKKAEKPGSFICGIRGPGPKYLLKTLVGYKDHCLSRYRNPAYTFGNRHVITRICEGPGPKYLLVGPKKKGFSFGLVGKSFGTCSSPGPKYLLPTPKSTAFTIKSRTKQRQKCVGPGPYYVKSPTPGPAFYIGRRIDVAKCDGTPGSRPYSIDLTKPKAPVYSLAYRLGAKAICRSPGPKYHPILPKPTPQYSFGTKHKKAGFNLCTEMFTSFP
ncbi:ciliary microtubule associated protein 1A isoform X2 [Osmia lignaria lignaria]|uniref:ciliary microtubule associated protein 1A isoform X2 n=1 Tax=Osmia lignaria lignaria TaxID=1437193 RepID=UPI0014795463|nr:outer dense fiber protein 3B-like isoform X2 [Osmia lignaria]